MFTRRKQGAINLISGAAPLAGESLPALGTAVTECLADGQPKAVFDMQNVPLMDSKGLELLLDLQDQFVRRAGELKLAAPSPLCRDILSATGIASQFEIYREVKTAIGSFVQ